MSRRSTFAFVMVVAAMLALAAPALAGGWATVTLDSLPREVRAGEQLQIGFVVRQHGKTPTNIDLNGKPLKPVVTARKQAVAARGRLLLIAAPSAPSKGEESIRVEARQEGETGHFVADVTFASDGVWEWQIEVPTFYVQNDAKNGPDNAAIFEPLTVLPASAPAQAQAPAAPAPATAEQPAVPAAPETTILGLSGSALRWGGAILLIAALGVALATQRGAIGRRRAARPQ